jgi:hypothetical protein
MTWDQTAEYRNDYTNFVYPTPSANFDPFNNLPLSFTFTQSTSAQLIVAFSPNGNSITENCDPPRYCLYFQKYQESGTHTVTWAGIDQNGNYRTDMNAFAVYFVRTTFSKNAVIVFGTKPTITNLAVSPIQYGPDFGMQSVNMNVTSYQSQPVTLILKFTNMKSKSVLRTITFNNVSPGAVSKQWDGKADGGMKVAPGKYIVTATVTDTVGNQISSQILTTIQY